jgi:hypothetical protein
MISSFYYILNINTVDIISYRENIMKISEKINQLLTSSDQDTNKVYYSFEYFPPKTESGTHI